MFVIMNKINYDHSNFNIHQRFNNNEYTEMINELEIKSLSLEDLLFKYGIKKALTISAKDYINSLVMLDHFGNATVKPIDIQMIELEIIE
ncbi:MAG: hypothetical protein QW303_07495 [Nitrososphaerota archaeon]